MKNNASFVYSFFLVIADIVSLVAAFAVAYLLRGALDARPVAHPVPAATYLGLLLGLIPFWLLIFGLLGLYNSNIYEKRFQEIGRLFIGSFVGLLFVIAIEYATIQTIFPSKLVPFYGFLLAFGFLVLLRNLARAIRVILFGFNVGISHILVVGDTKITEELVGTLKDSRTSGYKIIGIVTQKASASKRYPGMAIFSDFDTAAKHLKPEAIHGIIQTGLYTDADKNNQILNYAQEHHVSFRFIPGNTELFVGNLEVELFRQSVPVIAVHQTPLIGWGRILKRIFDMLVVLPLILIALPFMLLVTIGEVLFNGRGGIFFRQVRLTRFNHEFKVFKFRTIKGTYNGLTPEEAFQKMGKPELAKRYRANGDYLPKDPRFGWYGRILRATSLDELPQLFNVLRGDLSLVGPRPLIPQELAIYEKRHAILSVKSGLTGLAQVSGRRNIGFDERRKLDMYYVQNWTFWMDIIILLKTVRVILTGEGAK